jgi:hypothetical protein
MWVVARDHGVRSTPVPVGKWRNPNHRQIVADLLELTDGMLEGIVVHFGMYHGNVNVREATQQLHSNGCGIGSDDIMTSSFQNQLLRGAALKLFRLYHQHGAITVLQRAETRGPM